MSDKAGIAWTEATWNPLVGCSRVSAGCMACYAEREAYRLEHRLLQAKYEGTTRLVGNEPRWTGTVKLWEPHLEQPLRWKRPRRIFVNSMSDLFHESVKDEWIAAIFAVMFMAGHHTYQILTKRPERMREWMTWLCRQPDPAGLLFDALADFVPGEWRVGRAKTGAWPKSHIWLGVSVENQETADERIPLLLETPAAVRWVSYEPALGPVVFDQEWLFPRRDDTLDSLSWIVVGGESGASARPFDLVWARRVVEQGRETGVPVFVKQIGAKPWWNGIGAAPPDHIYLQPRVVLDGRVGWMLECLRDRKGGSMEDWPADLRVREYPDA